MKKLFAVIALCMTCAIATFAQMPEGYSVVDPNNNIFTETPVTTSENNDDDVVVTTSNKKFDKNQKRLDKYRRSLGIYKNGNFGATTVYVPNTTTTTGNTTVGNHSTGVFKKDPVVTQGNGIGGQVAAAIIVPLVRIGLSYLPPPQNGYGMNSMMFMNNGMGYYNNFGMMNPMYMNNWGMFR